LRAVSAAFFIAAIVAFLISLIYFELGTRSMRKGKKPKSYDKKGFRFLAIAGIFAGISFLIAFIL
jgi:hypothetical protein